MLIKLGKHGRQYRVGNGLIDTRRRLRPHGWMLSRDILYINACHEGLRTWGGSQDSVTMVTVFKLRLEFKHKTE